MGGVGGGGRTEEEGKESILIHIFFVPSQTPDRPALQAHTGTKIAPRLLRLQYVAS